MDSLKAFCLLLMASVLLRHSLGSVPEDAVDESDFDEDEKDEKKDSNVKKTCSCATTSGASKRDLSKNDVSWKQAGISQEEYVMLKRERRRTTKDALEMLASPEWTQLQKNSKGDTVSFLERGIARASFLLQGKVEARPKTLYDDMREDAEDVPSWNPTVQWVNILFHVSRRCYVFQQGVASGASGFFTARNFVNLSSGRNINGTYYLFYKSVNVSRAKSVENSVRGENGPSAFVMSPTPGNPYETDFKWLLNTDFKFSWWIQAMSSKIFPKVMLDYLSHLRSHVKRLKRVPVALQ
ncbi:unnamed protein product [Darwinula stevensoni]|uniref:START domain-containing protein n=1 Tax=Darwinula stevensoni TaxID=69355 RepID=A0A7R8XFP0_9CRUS|nr:unnamed protein product [Darwinula stevensoni]CAG0895244.1 unnamed protein product [Darwinula stevensoni]